MRLRFHHFIFFLIIASTWGQSVTDPSSTNVSVEQRQSSTLLNILNQSASLEKELKKKLDEVANTNTPPERKEALKSEIALAESKIAELRQQFSTVATGVKTFSKDNTNVENFSVEKALSEVASPIISQMREWTSKPREIEALKNRILSLKASKDKVNEALKNLDLLLRSKPDKSVEKALLDEQKNWITQRDTITTALDVAQIELDALIEVRGSIWQSISQSIAGFFKNRGLNLLVALLSALFTLVALFFLARMIRKYSPWHKKGRSFVIRLFDFAFQCFAVISVCLVVVMALYISGDWFLLTLAVFFIGSLIWAGQRGIAHFFEQAKFLLNLGSVREGERVSYMGISWKLQKLNYFSELHNPLLTGGKIRLPIATMLTLVSRPSHEHEIWFPCQQGDWVELNDGTYACVDKQTPELVVLELLGGSKKNIPTAMFLQMNPELFSKQFRIHFFFGMDYSHLPIVLTTVPEKMRHHIEQALHAQYDKAHILDVNVEFSSAAASSLDFEILVDLHGELAPKRRQIHRFIQSQCVQVCLDNGWTIPFPQLTVHQAAII